MDGKLLPTTTKALRNKKSTEKTKSHFIVKTVNT